MTRKPPPRPDDKPQTNPTVPAKAAATRVGMDAAWNNARDRRDRMLDERLRDAASDLHWWETPIPVIHNGLDRRDHLLWQDSAGALHLAIMHAPAPQQCSWLFTEGTGAADVVRWTLVTAPTAGPPPSHRLEEKMARRRTNRQMRRVGE